MWLWTCIPNGICRPLRTICKFSGGQRTPLSLPKFYARFARDPRSWSATDMNTCTADNIGRTVCKGHYDTYIMCPLCVDTQALGALNPHQQECMSRRRQWEGASNYVEQHRIRVASLDDWTRPYKAYPCGTTNKPHCAATACYIFIFTLSRQTI